MGSDPEDGGSEVSSEAATSRRAVLSPEEAQILRLLQAGHGAADISLIIGVSRADVQHLLALLLQKLRAGDLLDTEQSPSDKPPRDRSSEVSYDYAPIQEDLDLLLRQAELEYRRGQVLDALADLRNILHTGLSQIMLGDSDEPPIGVEAAEAGEPNLLQLVEALGASSELPFETLASQVPVERHPEVRRLLLDLLAQRVEDERNLRREIDAIAMGARAFGATYPEMGQAVGVTPQTAHQRWSPEGRAKNREKQRKRREQLKRTDG